MAASARMCERRDQRGKPVTLMSDAQWTEHTPAYSVTLSDGELAALRAMPNLKLAITPAVGSASRGTYDITPGSIVGVVRLGERTIHILPKFPIARLFFLLSYSTDPGNWRSGDDAHLAGDPDVLEAVVPSFTSQVKRALVRGLLHDYQQQEDALNVLRGRMRIDEQLRRRFGRLPPVECRFDEFTADVIENRLIRAATAALLRVRLRSNSSREALLRIDALLAEVTPTRYDARVLPKVALTRRNRHYTAALVLSRLILACASPEIRHGIVPCTGFILNMNKVFEAFVAVALREQLRLSELDFSRNAAGRRMFLDQGEQVRLKPDVSWWHRDGRCLFVGDVKYKWAGEDAVRHADLYQLLAYTVTAGLRSGMLIYGENLVEPARHVVVQAGKRLEVTGLDLRKSPSDILAQIAEIADQIRCEVAADSAR
jgi:5-methylcytosine-specific restriction enzyme subunit McrC